MNAPVRHANTGERASTNWTTINVSALLDILENRVKLVCFTLVLIIIIAVALRIHIQTFWDGQRPGAKFSKTYNKLK